MSVVVRAVVGLLLLFIAVPAAQAQDTGTYRSEPLDWGASGAWVDNNRDGKADYCRLAGNGELQCTLANGRGFGGTVTTPALDGGYPDGRLWGDVDGNGGADYCRRVGNGGPDQRYSCTLSTLGAFAPYAGPLPTLEWLDAPGALVDFTGDGRADYCRVTTDRAICSTFEGAGFGPGVGAALDPGPNEGRAWVDVNADGAADLCRVLAPTLTCTLSTGSAFGGTLSAGGLDLGWPAGRAWADMNGDGRADYCRRVGNGGADQRISCTLATPAGFGANYISGPVEWGADVSYAYVDFNGDGYRDFCRPVVSAATTQLFCTLWTPAGFGATIVSGPIDVGGDGAWVDHNADGKADYCRRVGGGSDTRVACTTSNGTAFGPVPVPVEPTPPAPPAPPAPVKKARLVVTLSYDYSVKGRYTRITRLQVKGVPAGATVKATCKKGCSRKSYSVKKRKRGTASLSRVVRKRLRAGTKVRVVVSRPGNLAAIKTLTIRASKRPTVKTG